MIIEYPTEYRDRFGSEQSMFISNGKTLKIKLRGIEFEGNFYELTPFAGQEEEASKLFDLNEFGELNAILDLTSGAKSRLFSLEVQIPIKIVSQENFELDALIDFSIGPDELNFIINGERHEFTIPNFEYGLIPIHTKSLDIKYVKCCVNCKFSEYSPYGNQIYGDMLCFKKCKKEWSEIGYSGLKNPENWEKVKNRETTQEAYWCDEFKLKDSN